jgi:hypothetical protein
MSNELE